MACDSYHVTIRLAGLESAVTLPQSLPPSFLFLFSLNSLQGYFLPLRRCFPFPTSDGWTSSAGMVKAFIITICGFISNLLRVAWRSLVSEPAGIAVSQRERGLSFREVMEELSPKELAVKQLKQQFLEALQANNAQEVMEILHTRKLDIDTVLEVDDPSMILASYKQGKEEEIDPQ